MKIVIWLLSQQSQQAVVNVNQSLVNAANIYSSGEQNCNYTTRFAHFVAKVDNSGGKGVAFFKHVPCGGSPGLQQLGAEKALYEVQGLPCCSSPSGGQQVHQAQVHNAAHLQPRAPHHKWFEQVRPNAKV